jgi:hypothetical protein
MPDSEATECLQCPYPLVSTFEPSVGCFGMCICLTREWKFAVFICFPIIFFACVLASVVKSKHKIAILVTLFSPALDVFSDLAYILTSRFYHTSLFGVSVGLFGVQVLNFVYRLYDLQAFPRLVVWESNDVILFSYVMHYFPTPTFRGKPIQFFEKPDSLMSWAALLMTWILAFISQIVLVISWVVLLVVYPGFQALWFCLGVFFHITKLLALREVWDFWMLIWMGDHRSKRLRDDKCGKLCRISFSLLMYLSLLCYITLVFI